MTILKLNEDYKDIESEAIIECMIAEIEILEMKLQSLIMKNQKKLKLLNKGGLLYDRYRIAYMDPEINVMQPNAKAWINKLKIVSPL